MTTNWDPSGPCLRIWDLDALPQLPDLPPTEQVPVPAGALREALEHLLQLSEDRALLALTAHAVDELHHRGEGGVCGIDGQPQPCRTVTEMYAAQGMTPDTGVDPTSPSGPTWRRFDDDEADRSALAQRWAGRYTPQPWRDIVAHDRGHQATGSHSNPAPTGDLTDDAADQQGRRILRAHLGGSDR